MLLLAQWLAQLWRREPPGVLCFICSPSTLATKYRGSGADYGARYFASGFLAQVALLRTKYSCILYSQHFQPT
ncbi:hypothetical protein BDP55DRAFT_646873 [Colletotrichum godetiae]|uniref:Uncharacterized protein n=1 Tax=Colletotrichum godetiae TaxID=1209918 RepID=A0AAJ0EYT6_9PEZI|nr:uncharacterized protein BDP55DRAFT_646873 [Colletotrichum godetiae]KAK1691390.1 hypothetical protein BDP55DRAFT_646873 [Colletotrichum godetiae]